MDEIKASNEPITIVIGTFAEYLKLTLWGRPFPDAENEWDRDIIDVDVDALSGLFSASLRTITWSHELALLTGIVTDLERQVGREVDVSFEFREATIDLSMTLD